MDKRVSTRLPANKEIIFFSNNSRHFGTIVNCSQTGMYIKTMISFPFSHEHEIYVPLKKEIVIVPVKVIRVVNKGNLYTGMGVKILHLPKKYLEFIIKLNMGILKHGNGGAYH